MSNNNFTYNIVPRSDFRERLKTSCLVLLLLSLLMFSYGLLWTFVSNKYFELGIITGIVGCSDNDPVPTQWNIQKVMRGDLNVPSRT